MDSNNNWTGRGLLAGIYPWATMVMPVVPGSGPEQKPWQRFALVNTFDAATSRRESFEVLKCLTSRVSSTH